MASVKEQPPVSFRKLPKHVGIIMDGNGRWATIRGILRNAGHRSGVERLRGIIRLTSNLGIEVLTLYTFSTENWKRSASEVDGLFSLMTEFLSKEIDELNRNRVRICTLGDITKFPKTLYESVVNAVELTKNNNGLKCCIALNYGGRTEIVRAARLLAQEVMDGKIKPADIDEQLFQKQLYTYGLPDLDFLIRTGGEKRLSNFLLYQAAYTELFFTDVFWPDFSDEQYLNALREFEKRDRRFGNA